MRVKLVTLRKDLGLSQEMAAEKLHISRSHYSQIESGDKTPSLGIADLEMQLEYLMQELSNYSSVLSVLKSCTSVKSASDEVLTKFEKPADQSAAVKTKRAGYGQTYYDKYAKGASTTMSYSNSKLVNCTVKSPNHSGTRTHKIDRITPHCVVGQFTAALPLPQPQQAAKYIEFVKAGATVKLKRAHSQALQMPRLALIRIADIRYTTARAMRFTHRQRAAQLQVHLLHTR